MRLLDLPDDALRCVLARCGMRARLCLASTCAHLRRLGADVPLPPMTMTCRQAHAQRWLCTDDARARLRVLVAKRCLHDDCPWLHRLGALARLELRFCRVPARVIEWLPARLEHLELHMVVPSGPRPYARLAFAKLERLHTLRVTFGPQWHTVFVARLPKSLRALCLRNSYSMVIESRMPRGLRDVHLHSRLVMSCANRLPSGVRRVRLECDAGRAWLAATLPRAPRRLEELCVASPLVARVPNLAGMPRLRALRLNTATAVLSCRDLARASSLRTLDIEVSDWLGFSDTDWPRGAPLHFAARTRVRGIWAGARPFEQLSSPPPPRAP